MAKEIKSQIKLRIPGGAATPAPPVGSMLGQHKVNIMEFCKQFNARTADKKGQTVAVALTVYTDASFTFELKTAPVSDLIKKRAGVAKGSSKPNEIKVGKLTWKDVDEIAEIKMPDLNVNDIAAARKVIAGSARSMGIDIID
jgi:large subunit ribosomal protein L11